MMAGCFVLPGAIRGAPIPLIRSILRAETRPTQGLPTIFKLTAASCPQDLDTLLAERGYQADAYTSVQLLDLTHWDQVAAVGVSLAQSETEEWQAAFCRMSGIGQAYRTTRQQILKAIMPATCFASILVDGRVVGCGLGVMQAGFMGLFDIVIDRDHRRQGYGERLVRNLLVWGRQHGADTAYLQVSCSTMRRRFNCMPRQASWKSINMGTASSNESEYV